MPYSNLHFSVTIIRFAIVSTVPVHELVIELFAAEHY